MQVIFTLHLPCTLRTAVSAETADPGTTVALHIMTVLLFATEAKMCSVDSDLLGELSEWNLILRRTTSGLEAGIPSMFHEIAKLLATHLRFTIDPRLAFTEVGLLIKTAWVQNMYFSLTKGRGVYHLFIHEWLT